MNEGVVDPASFFLHYQLTINTNYLLLTAIKNVATFLTVNLQPLAVVVNQN